MEKVSVNITTYNRSQVLKRCLESVFRQNYKNIEIILVDDHSTDDTPDVIQSYLEKYDCIKYIRNSRNRGNAYSRNAALRNSTGYYIALLDDDDEWLDSNKLSKQVSVFDTSPDNVAIVSTSVKSIDSNGVATPKIVQMPFNLNAHILKRNGIIYNSTVLTKKNILDELGGFDINLPRGIDSDFFRECIIRGGYDIIIMEDITTAVHEYGSDRITASNDKNSLRDVLKSNLYILGKYRDQFVYHPFSFLFRIKTIVKTSFKLLSLILPKRLVR